MEGGRDVRREAHASPPMSGGGQCVSFIVERSSITEQRQTLLRSKRPHIKEGKTAISKTLAVKNATEHRNSLGLAYNIKRKWDKQKKKTELRLVESKSETLSRNDTMYEAQSIQITPDSKDKL